MIITVDGGGLKMKGQGRMQTRIPHYHGPVIIWTGSIIKSACMPMPTRKAIPLCGGYGLIRFNKELHEATFECWPRICRCYPTGGPSI